VIKHWKIHNYIQKDRYKETKYIEEKATLMLDENGAYTECIQGASKADALGIPNGNQMDTQVSIGKGSSVKVNLVEGSVDDDTAAATEENQLKCIGGDLGKGVVYLTDNQFDDLVVKLGIDGFDRYMDRLSTFIIDKGAHIKSHYETILKWYEQDSKVGG
jgi:hypothetical protein